MGVRKESAEGERGLVGGAGEDVLLDVALFLKRGGKTTQDVDRPFTFLQTDF